MLDPDSPDYIEQLILEGGIEVVGVDQETGEFLYSFTDKLPLIDNNLYTKMLSDFYSEIINLWQKGFIDMDVTQKNPILKLTPKALDALQTQDLTFEDRVRLEEIARKLAE